MGAVVALSHNIHALPGDVSVLAVNVTSLSDVRALPGDVYVAVLSDDVRALAADPLVRRPRAL